MDCRREMKRNLLIKREEKKNTQGQPGWYLGRENNKLLNVIAN